MASCTSSSEMSGPHQLKTALLDPAFTHAEPGINADFNADTLHMTASSPVQPPMRHTLHLATGQWQAAQSDAASEHGRLAMAALASQHLPWHHPHQHWWQQASFLLSRLLQQAWLQGRATSQESASPAMRCSVHQVASTGGVAVPLTISHADGIAMDGSHPALLLVYGAYGTSLPACWDPWHIPLLVRGWVIGHAHVRGGAVSAEMNIQRSCVALAACHSTHNCSYGKLDLPAGQHRQSAPLTRHL